LKKKKDEKESSSSKRDEILKDIENIIEEIEELGLRKKYIISELELHRPLTNSKKSK